MRETGGDRKYRAPHPLIKLESSFAFCPHSYSAYLPNHNNGICFSSSC
jgi:hypothetical protein